MPPVASPIDEQRAASRGVRPPRSPRRGPRPGPPGDARGRADGRGRRRAGRWSARASATGVGRGVGEGVGVGGRGRRRAARRGVGRRAGTGSARRWCGLAWATGEASAATRSSSSPGSVAWSRYPARPVPLLSRCPSGPRATTTVTRRRDRAPPRASGPDDHADRPGAVVHEQPEAVGHRRTVPRPPSRRASSRRPSSGSPAAPVTDGQRRRQRAGAHDADVRGRRPGASAERVALVEGAREARTRVPAGIGGRAAASR